MQFDPQKLAFNTQLSPETIASGLPPDFLQSLSSWLDPSTGSPVMGTGFTPGRLGVDTNSTINLQETLGGWQKGAIGANIGTSALNGILGLKQYGLAKDQLNFQKDAYNKNYTNQRDEYNRRLEENQRAKLRMNPDKYESLDTYLEKNRVK